MGLVILTGLLTYVFAQAPAAPVVTTEGGAVSGLPGDVVVFKGIPFARPPVGDLRWKPPIPPEKWPGVKPATEFGPACMQAGNIRKSEDCLYLNIWAPRSAQNLPIMVWSHGGSLTAGSGNIDGTALARRGVIVVSFNYRVSTFGFMAHPQLTAESPNRVSGNYGLLDAMAALRWVRDNIGRFGGDPGRVTLWGQSAGGSVVTALMVSPLSNGLFQRVIIQSPGAMRHLNTLRVAEQQGLAIGADVAALRRLPADQIPLLQNLGGGADFRSLFEPRVIGQTLDGYVLPNEEREIFESGLVKSMPVIIGNNTDEGATFTREYPVKTAEAYREYLSDVRIFGSFGREALTQYPVSSDAEIPRAISDSFADSQFHFGTRSIARTMSAGGSKVYRYLFTRKSDGGTGHDPWHGAEMPYVRGQQLNSPQYSEQDRSLSATIMDAWIRFAETGSPNGGAIRNWPTYDPSSEPYLILDAVLGTDRGLRDKQLDFIGRIQKATRK